MRIFSKTMIFYTMLIDCTLFCEQYMHWINKIMLEIIGVFVTPGWRGQKINGKNQKRYLRASTAEMFRKPRVREISPHLVLGPCIKKLATARGPTAKTVIFENPSKMVSSPKRECSASLSFLFIKFWQY